MRPGELQSSDGSVISGFSPSGAPRGDVFVSPPELPGYVGISNITSRQLRGGAGGGGGGGGGEGGEGGSSSWPALEAVDAAVLAATTALARSLEGLEPRSRLSLLTLTAGLFACFAGDGGRYGAHTDGGETNSLSVILYSSLDWREEHGGEIHMLDAGSHCWQALPPRADTLLFFCGHRVVHKVEPAHVRPRYALTMFADRARNEDFS